MTVDGTLPVICIRPRGRGELSHVMDMFSRVPIRSVRGAFRGEIVRVGVVPVVKSIRCAADELAYRLQLSSLCEGNRGYTGVRSLLVRFVDGSTEVISFYRLAHGGADRLARCNQPESQEAAADREKLMRRAERLRNKA